MKTLWHESIDDIADIINSGATVKNDALYNLMEDIQCLMEELETLRASNRIKQANIELLELNVNRLEALNRSFEANEKRLLETARVLRAENAKLIAERGECSMNWDQYQMFITLLMCCDPFPFDGKKYDEYVEFANEKAKEFGFDDWIEALHAKEPSEDCMKVQEREAMMKPKHKRADELLVGDHIKKFGEFVKIFQITNNGGYIKINFEESYLPPEALIEMAHPPAQQIPEGLIEWLRNFEKMTYDTGYLWMAKDARKFIDLLSASQPKGES
jgi:hypothetical protein